MDTREFSYGKDDQRVFFFFPFFISNESISSLDFLNLYIHTRTQTAMLPYVLVCVRRDIHHLLVLLYFQTTTNSFFFFFLRIEIMEEVLVHGVPYG